MAIWMVMRDEGGYGILYYRGENKFTLFFEFKKKEKITKVWKLGLYLFIARFGGCSQGGYKKSYTRFFIL